MRFFALTKATAEDAILKTEYKEGRSIGKVHLGTEHFFFKEGLKTYYIPYAEITRVFRRVMLIQTKMCCGKGNLEVENFVICTKEGEVALIQLPGARAGIVLLEEMARLAPHAEVGRPKETE